MAKRQEAAGGTRGPGPASSRLSQNQAIGIGVGVVLILIVAITLGVTLGGKGGEKNLATPSPDTDMSLPSTPGKAECLPDWMAVYDMCFILSTETKDWMASKATCENKRATLAIITRQQLDILKKNVSSSDYWIGLKKDGTGWVWVDDSAFNNEFNIRGAGDCAYLDSNSVNSAGCSQPRRWICSKPPQSSSG
ncbi:C-type lectin domain family 2 member B-like isoform X2 [Tachyglossus aculeatus]|uniref:C-type lectin domain family 2 member B-like isoform X2 n=1 Tax=Tachyglossus aculeatus TaxID=9261 RepID=UPI0018F6C556|nr:C-type lectin domain family 2 member B-like isoform X2 [Tachyglossus aculeatus]